MSRGGRMGLCAWLLVGVLVPVYSQTGTIQTIRYGEIVSARETVVRDQPTGTGARAGATIGSIAGRSVAKRGNRWAGALLGGAIGSGAGHAIEKSAKKHKGWELVIRFEGTGEEVGLQVPANDSAFRPGDRVRLMTGPNGRTDVEVVDAPS
jgi:outer membrane lipoprotein SlyB